MGKTEKKWKENHATKVTKIPKTKRQKYGMKETYISNTVFSISTSLLPNFHTTFFIFVSSDERKELIVLEWQPPKANLSSLKQPQYK